MRAPFVEVAIRLGLLGILWLVVVVAASIGQRLGA